MIFINKCQWKKQGYEVYSLCDVAIWLILNKNTWTENLLYFCIENESYLSVKHIVWFSTFRRRYISVILFPYQTAARPESLPPLFAMFLAYLPWRDKQVCPKGKVCNGSKHE